MASGGMTAAAFNSYQQSVHGKAVAAGSEKAAVCTDCHGEHDILRAGDPKSPINKFNVPTTCAKCHANVKAEYMQSIHGTAVARGNWQAPVCTDCHGIHTIKAPKDANSSVAAANVQEHLRFVPRGRAPVERVRRAGRSSYSSYLASYHGMASKVGSQRRGQLRQLPRRAQHPPIQRSAFDHQSRAIWRRPAASAIRAPTRNLFSTKVHLDGTQQSRRRLEDHR